MTKKIGLALALVGVIALAGSAPLHDKEVPTAASHPVGSGPACVDNAHAWSDACPDPGRFLETMLAAANHSHNMSEVLRALHLPNGTPVGALVSRSVQASDGNYDPRMFVHTPCGYLAFTLFGDTLELGLDHQHATLDLPAALDKGAPVRNGKVEGEVFVEIAPFPREPHAKPLGAEDIVNQWRHGYKTDSMGDHDTHECSDCHIDSKTVGSLGMIPLSIGGKRIEALVSPFMTDLGTVATGKTYCVPEDLTRLYRCRCATPPGAPEACRGLDPMPAKLKRHDPSYEEACARLSAVLDLAPRPDCTYQPSRQSPPKSCLIGQ